MNKRCLDLEQMLKESKRNDKELRSKLIDMARQHIELSKPCERCIGKAVEKQDTEYDVDTMTKFEDLENKVSEDWHEFN